MEVHELAKQIETFAKETREDLAVIKRGVYGDKENKVKGLLERQDIDEKRMDGLDGKLEKVDRKLWKVGVLMGAGVAAIDFIIMYIKNFTSK
jgi:hypothetical protein